MTSRIKIGTRVCELKKMDPNTTPTSIKVDTGQTIKFDLHMDRAVFEIIRRKDTRGKLAKYVKLGWSDHLTDAIWDSRRLPCSWSFKHATPKGENVKINGHCVDCKAEFAAAFRTEEQKLVVKIEGFKNIEHKSKRRTTHQRKVEIAHMLKGSSAFKVRSELADKLMTASDIEPAHLPSQNALRKIKSKQEKSLDKDPRKALQIMKRNDYREQIHHIGFDPFFVFYWTKLQKEWFRAEFKHKRCSISIDATGMGFKKIDTVEPKYTFLYVICAKGKHFNLS